MSSDDTVHYFVYSLVNNLEVLPSGKIVDCLPFQIFQRFLKGYLRRCKTFLLNPALLELNPFTQRQKAKHVRVRVSRIFLQPGDFRGQLFAL